MTWLVTGVAGYIGAHIVDNAFKSGRSVVVVDDLSSGIRSRLKNEIEFNEISLLDPEALNKVFQNHNISGVLHLAAKKRVGESIQRPDYYWKENMGGITNLLGSMQKYQVKNFVYSSSAAVYGQPKVSTDCLISEETDCAPINPYGETKLQGEALARALAETDNFNVVALRYFNVAGAGRPELGDRYIFNLIPIVFDALDRSEKPVVFGDDYSTPDGSCIRDFVHVQDLAEAHMAAMDFIEEGDPGFTAINIGTGVGASVFEVLKMIQKVTGKEIYPKPALRREGDPAALVADVSKAKEALNWSSRRDLREIVESAWEAWQFNKK